MVVMLAGGAALTGDTAVQLTALKAEERTVPELGLKMVRIEAGSLVMGSPKTEPDRREDEVRHKVTISKPFYMGAYEVTQKQYYDIMLPDFDHDSWQYVGNMLEAPSMRALHFSTERERQDTSTRAAS